MPRNIFPPPVNHPLRTTCLCTTAFVFFTFKSAQALSALNWKYLSTYLWLPSIFYSDYVYLILMFILSDLSPLLEKNKTVAFLFKLLTYLLCFLAISLVSLDFSSLISYGSRINWAYLPKILQEWDDYKNMVGSNFYAFAFIYASFILLFLFLYSFLNWRANVSHHQPLPTNAELFSVEDEDLLSDTMNYESNAFMFPETIMEPEVPSLEKKLKLWKYRIRKTAGLGFLAVPTSLLALMCLYAVAILALRPDNPWNQISDNEVFSAIINPIRGIRSVFSKSATPINAPIRNMITDDTTQLLDTVGRIGTNNDSVPQFLRRGDHSVVNNIVLIFLETSRNNMFPMDNTTDWFTQYIRNDAPLVTPFFENLVKKGFYAPYTKSASGYTIKSMMSTLCSMWPKPEDFAKEYLYSYYRPCLPELLANNGFNTSFFQPTDIFFDHQHDVLEKTGFQFMFSRNDIQNGALGDPSQYKPSTYFGYEDNIMIPLLSQWASENKKNHQPFLLSYLTAQTHDPYVTPEGWKQETFSNDEKANGYLNALNYQDQFLAKLMEAFQNGGIMNDTLFVFVGDHGIAMHEHGSIGTYRLTYDIAYDVPLLFYSEIPSLKKVLQGQSSIGNRTTVDILPTIFDLLNDRTALQIGKEITQFDYISTNLSYPTDGFSLFFPAPENRTTFSMANPGFTSITAREGTKVLVKYSETGNTELFDIAKDPEQNSPILDNDIDDNLKKWKDSILDKLNLFYCKVMSRYEGTKYC